MSVEAVCHLWETARDGWFIADAGARIVHANGALSELFRRGGSLSGCDITHFLVPQARLGVKRSLQRVAAGELTEYQRVVPVSRGEASVAFGLGLTRLTGFDGASFVMGVFSPHRQHQHASVEHGAADTGAPEVEVSLARAVSLIETALDGDEPTSARPLDGHRFTNLSNRQNEVVSLLVSGHDPAAIARRLFISPLTVRNHMATIYRRLGVHSEAQLIALCRARRAHPSNYDEPYGPGSNGSTQRAHQGARH